MTKENNLAKLFRAILYVVISSVSVGATAGWAVTPLSSEASAQQWIDQMSQSVRELNYRGRSILLNGNQLNSVEVIHGIVNGEPWERIIHLSGKPAEILRRGKQISCLHPESSKDFQAFAGVSPLKKISSEQFKIPAHYMLRKGGSGRVAGRIAYRVDVLPKDKSRYGYQLWLDQASGLLLKSVTVDRKSRGLEVFEFVSLEINVPIGDDLFTPGEGLQWVEKPSALPAEDDSSLEWRLTWLPSGFALAEKEMRVIGGVHASTKVFSDGLAAFSVFLEKIDSRFQSESTQINGATTALSRRLPVKGGEYLVTVVGEIPMETAMQIAMAVKLDAAP